MLSPKALKNMKKAQKWASTTPKSTPTKFVECKENDQIYNWQRTNKKCMLIPKKEFMRQLATLGYHNLK